MNFFSYDQLSLEDAIIRTTHLAIVSHPDDLEIMANHAITECQKKNKYFTGVIITDGSRGDLPLAKIREEEQIEAAKIGKYNLVIFLSYPSNKLKENSTQIIEELKNIITKASAKYAYIHNPFDKHSTHRLASILSIAALKNSPPVSLVLGCEVWGNLDWPIDKITLKPEDCGLIKKIITPFKSQLAIKKYDEATIFRLKSNAIFDDPHSQDNMLLSYAIDLTKIYEEDTKTLLSRILDDFKTHQLQNILDIVSSLP